MNAYADPWDWDHQHRKESNRETATEWHRVGALPIVVRFGCMVFLFDGSRVRIGYRC